MASLAVLCDSLGNADRKEGQDKSMSAEENNKALMRRSWTLWEQGKIDLLDDLLAPGYTNHTIATFQTACGHG